MIQSKKVEIFVKLQYMQLACMKLGTRDIYQPIQYCWVHTCHLRIYGYPTNMLQYPDRHNYMYVPVVPGLYLAYSCGTVAQEVCISYSVHLRARCTVFDVYISLSGSNLPVCFMHICCIFRPYHSVNKALLVAVSLLIPVFWCC